MSKDIGLMASAVDFVDALVIMKDDIVDLVNLLIAASGWPNFDRYTAYIVRKRQTTGKASSHSIRTTLNVSGPQSPAYWDRTSARPVLLLSLQTISSK